jgi:hypothetical protein
MLTKNAHLQLILKKMLSKKCSPVNSKKKRSLGPILVKKSRQKELSFFSKISSYNRPVTFEPFLVTLFVLFNSRQKYRESASQK